MIKRIQSTTPEYFQFKYSNPAPRFRPEGPVSELFGVDSLSFGNPAITCFLTRIGRSDLDSEGLVYGKIVNESGGPEFGEIVFESELVDEKEAS